MQGTILSNRYLIADEIGVGGMGNVYRATDLRTGGEVAVKIPHAFLARNPEYMERLRREAQIAASIYSPRVVRVMDLDTHEGAPYLVMEYVPGETLADIQRRQGRFSLIDTLTVGLEVARALEAAHAKGIVHRDLKPQNIKLVDGEVKVLDFGIAKAEGFANVTAASVFMGTPEYCAPERAEGLGDIRSDIYSLGVIMFEMHEGHLPFQAATPLALMKKHESEPAPPLTGDVPAAVQAIAARCLAKNPEDRYQTPRELVQALRGALDAPATIAPTLRRGGFTPTVRQARDADAADLPATIPFGQHDGATAGGAPALDASTAVMAPAGPSAPARPRRSALLMGAVALVLLVGGAIALVAVRGQDSGAATPTTVPIAATNQPTAPPATASVQAGTATPQRTAPPPPPLLALGQQRSLETVPAVQIELPPPCSGARSTIRFTSISAAQNGRVTVAYALTTPRVAGLECEVAYPADANCRCVVLETRVPNGPPVAVRNVGGAGVSATGAPNIYGTPVSGEWWFDNAELNGTEMLLIREFAGTSDVQFTVTLLRP